MTAARQRMLQMIRDQDTCVLATAGGGVPHASLMAYLAAEGGRRLYLITSAHTRKYRNILDNPRVSLLLDTRGAASRGGRVQALTVSGLCWPLEGAREQEQIKEQFMARHPHLQGIARDPVARVLAVEVETLQLLDGPEQSLLERLK